MICLSWYWHIFNSIMMLLNAQNVTWGVKFNLWIRLSTFVKLLSEVLSQNCIMWQFWSVEVKLGLTLITTVVYIIPISLIKIVNYQTSLCDFNKGSEQLSTTWRRHFVWHLIQSEFAERATHKMKWNKMKWHSDLPITIQFCVRGSGREFLWNITVISENLERCNRAGGRGGWRDCLLTIQDKCILKVDDMADGMWWENSGVKFTLGDNESGG